MNSHHPSTTMFPSTTPQQPKQINTNLPLGTKTILVKDDAIYSAPIEFAKISMSSLHRYAAHFSIPFPPNPTKEELLTLVSQHYLTNMPHLRVPQVLADFTFRNYFYNMGFLDLDMQLEKTQSLVSSAAQQDQVIAMNIKKLLCDDQNGDLRDYFDKREESFQLHFERTNAGQAYLDYQLECENAVKVIERDQSSEKWDEKLSKNPYFQLFTTSTLPSRDNFLSAHALNDGAQNGASFRMKNEGNRQFSSLTTYPSSISTPQSTPFQHKSPETLPSGMKTLPILPPGQTQPSLQPIPSSLSSIQRKTASDRNQSLINGLRTSYPPQSTNEVSRSTQTTPQSLPWILSSTQTSATSTLHPSTHSSARLIPLAAAHAAKRVEMDEKSTKYQNTAILRPTPLTHSSATPSPPSEPISKIKIASVDKSVEEMNKITFSLPTSTSYPTSSLNQINQHDVQLHQQGGDDTNASETKEAQLLNLLLNPPSTAQPTLFAHYEPLLQHLINQRYQSELEILQAEFSSSKSPQSTSPQSSTRSKSLHPQSMSDDTEQADSIPSPQDTRSLSPLSPLQREIDEIPNQPDIVHQRELFEAILSKIDSIPLPRPLPQCAVEMIDPAGFMHTLKTSIDDAQNEVTNEITQQYHQLENEQNNNLIAQQQHVQHLNEFQQHFAKVHHEQQMNQQQQQQLQGDPAQQQQQQQQQIIDANGQAMNINAINPQMNINTNGALGIDQTQQILHNQQTQQQNQQNELGNANTQQTVDLGQNQYQHQHQHQQYYLDPAQQQQLELQMLQQQYGLDPNQPLTQEGIEQLLNHHMQQQHLQQQMQQQQHHQQQQGFDPNQQQPPR